MPLIIGVVVALLAVIVGTALAVSSKTNPSPSQNDPDPSATSDSVQPTAITWPEAVELIRSCRVKSVSQTHDRQVGLTLNDGTGRNTTEPELDQVVQLAQAVMSKCGPITIVTE
ncbi:MAG TPA: hypothetical protein VK963_02740 [Candidatus Saccharimonadales bacterium]|nr:hypothetical protein [Candidatus Saccharimonadales bacterium]